MSQEEYLVHISELPADVEKSDLEEFFQKNDIEGINISVIKSHYKLPIKWAKVSMGNSANYNKAISELRYPMIKHNVESRLLENITDGSLKTVSETNAVVKGLNKEKVDSSSLDKFFTDKIGKVKCCKVSKTIGGEEDQFSSKSNGYGFVNFESKELLDKAIEELNGTELEGETITIERYNKDIKKESKFNNLYVRGFDESFTEEQLREQFAKFGELGSVKLMKDEEGNSKKFGFVCFVESAPAIQAVEEMNNKDLGNGNTLYVARFEKKANRWAALKKSLARANLYVRNFDKNVTEEDLKSFFGGEGVVRNVRIMTTDVNREDGVYKESKQFGFVSFNSPAEAAKVMAKYQAEELEFNNKQLYVNYYEDKAARKKRLATSKKDNLMGILDQSMSGAAGGDQNNMMEYFMQVFQQYFKQNLQGGQGNFGGQYQSYNQYNKNYDGDHYHNRRHRRPHRGNYGQYNQYGHGPQNMYSRPRQDVHNSYANAGSSIPSTAPPMASQMPPAPVSQPPMAGPPVSQPPVAGPPVAAPPVGAPPVGAPVSQPPAPSATNMSASYIQSITSLMNSNDYISLDEDGKREKIGEEIYNFVLAKAGDESAPKITGMIIDLPFSDLLASVKSWEGLQEKIQEGLDLLQEDA